MSKIINFDEKLLHCIKNGRNNDVKLFIWNLTEAHKRTDNLGATLLHYAAEYGNGGIARYLIELGSDVDTQNSLGQTPLMLAIREERVTTIRVLLECNASIHITDNNGKSPLKMVVESSLISESTIQTFLNRLKEETSFDRQLLVQKLRDINCPLRIALFLDDAEVTRMMLDKGDCSIDDPDPEMGDTALHIAVRRSSLEHVKLLIDYGANVNAYTLSGCTPLSNLELKFKDQSLEILKFLLDRGAMIFTEKDGEKRCQISYLLEYGCKRVINLLMQYDVDLCAVDNHASNVLHYLARNINWDVFDELKGKKFNVNARNNAFYTPLQLVSNNYSSLRFLLNNGADVNVSRDGITPFTKIFLSLWVINGRFSEICKCVKLFLKLGADPQHITPDGMTIFNRDLDKHSFLIYTPVLAYLAVLEDRGTPIIKRIRDEIEAKEALHKYYCKCKEELDHLKTIVVWESITAYKLLTVSEKQLAMYMRQRQLIELIYRFLNPPYASVYAEIMQERVEKAVLTAELWENSTSSFCDLLELSYEKYYNVIESMVISYLSEEDMRNLCLLNGK